ncbi:hypothetical protein ACLB1N_05380 [Escherichia coli]
MDLDAAVFLRSTEAIVKRLQQESWFVVPATTIWRVGFPSRRWETVYERFQAHQQSDQIQPTASELHLLPGWKSIPTNLALH